MRSNTPRITGIGSVSPFGVLAGLIPPSHPEPAAVTGWPTDGLRRAFLVKPFQPAGVVPGVKTRRLDRLSAWALVTASLALRDAGIDLDRIDRSRVAVVFATRFGCIGLTEAFYQSAFKNTWAGTDPITFPETLANSPAGHVALFHNLRGPNITVSSKNFAGECALLQAASLLRNGQADMAVVIAGDTLTQTMYEWYETANLLSQACFDADIPQDTVGSMPEAAAGARTLICERGAGRLAGSRSRGFAAWWRVPTCVSRSPPGTVLRARRILQV
jgi:3-oxoacyl-(acyl-carrier-protein) synthase